MTTRDRITWAIRDGFGRDNTRSVPVVHDTYQANHVFVEGFADPIVVLDDDVIVPDALASCVPGIRLDVQAVLAEAA